MIEPVRMVIWDLDGTFWRGTLAEEGITDYILAHHNIVVTLAERGILSSICSKNDFSNVEAVLRERKIWDYFVFPSIDWTPKGRRVADLIDTFQLRPSTVRFIDDNPNNLAEVRSFVPEIQIANETSRGLSR
jgi:FkbH-like protein